MHFRPSRPAAIACKASVAASSVTDVASVAAAVWLFFAIGTRIYIAIMTAFHEASRKASCTTMVHACACMMHSMGSYLRAFSSLPGFSSVQRLVSQDVPSFMHHATARSKLCTHVTRSVRTTASFSECEGMSRG